jgi:hypothetical protein
MRGAASSLAIAHSITFSTHPLPPTVIHYKLTLLMPDLATWDRNATFSYSSPITRAADLFIVMQENGDHQTARKELGLTWSVYPLETSGSWEMQVEMEGYFTGSKGDYETTISMFQGLARDTGVEGVVESHSQMSKSVVTSTASLGWSRCLV